MDPVDAGWGISLMTLMTLSTGCVLDVAYYPGLTGLPQDS